MAKIHQDPLLYCDELAREFKAAHMRENLTMSNSTVLRIPHEANLTHQVVKRIAIQIRTQDIARFTREIVSCMNDGCTWASYLFSDEVSTDSRDMQRKRGWFLRGGYPWVQQLYGRTERISLIAFLGVSGLSEVYHSMGTMDRVSFLKFVKRYVASKKAQQYPSNILCGF